MYTDKVVRVLRMGDLEGEDGNSDNNEGGKDKSGTTMTPSMAKNCDEEGQKELGNDHCGKEK